MRIQLSISADVFYRGVKKNLAKFSEFRPVFFTKNLPYAQQYGDVVLKAQLNVKKFFDTRTDARAVEIYNEHFLTSGLANANAKTIKLGTPVAANDADELWSYLSVPEYPAPHYDGIIVSEGDVGNLHPSMKGAEFSYVPMHVNQIKLVK